jgi:hypothetical protein
MPSNLGVYDVLVGSAIEVDRDLLMLGESQGSSAVECVAGVKKWPPATKLVPW